MTFTEMPFKMFHKYRIWIKYKDYLCKKSHLKRHVYVFGKFDDVMMVNENKPNILNIRF